jgi:hypothetical protein
LQNAASCIAFLSVIPLTLSASEGEGESDVLPFFLSFP